MTTTIHEDPTTAPATMEARVQTPSTVPNYHAVGSVPAGTLNKLIGDLYRVFREAFFKGKLQIPEPVLIDLDYDVRTAPVISFAAGSAEVDDAIRERVLQAMAEARLEGSVEEAVRALAGPVTFTGEMAEVILGYQFQGQPRREVKIGVVMSGVPEIVMQGTRRVIRPKLVTIRVKGPDPETEAFINKQIAPLLVPILNGIIAKHWKLPPLDFVGVSFSAPELRAAANVLLVYSAVEATGPSVAPPNPQPIGPGDRMTVAIDDVVANTAVRAATHGKQFPLGPFEVDLKLAYFRYYSTFWLADPQLRFAMTNWLLGTFTGGGNGSITIRVLPFDPVHPTVSIRTTPVVAASLNLREGWVGLSGFTLSELRNTVFEFSFLPWWANAVLSKIIEALGPLVLTVVGNILALLGVRFFKVPSQQVSFGGVKATIAFDQTAVTTIQADGKVFGLASGVAVAIS